MPHQNQVLHCIFKDGGEIVYRMFWIHDEYATGDSYKYTAFGT